MYKADIVNTTISRGKLSVEVLFHDGEDTFTDTIETTQYQDNSWIGDQITRRLKHLNSLYDLKNNIVIGPVFEKELTDPAKELYQTKTALYHNYMNWARMGIVAHDIPIIGELRTWLRENFKEDFMS